MFGKSRVVDPNAVVLFVDTNRGTIPHELIVCNFPSHFGLGMHDAVAVK